MLDDRTMRRAQKPETLKNWPNATCQKVDGVSYVILNREAGQPKFIGEGLPG